MRRFADSIAWSQDRGFAINAAVDERMGFLRRTYSYLLIEICVVGAIASFVVKTPALLNSLAIPLISNIWIYLLAFFGVSFVSRRLMAGHKSSAVQHTGAALWVVLLGLLVAPIAYIVQQVTGSYTLLAQAFLMTAGIFGGLTAYVLMSRKDFSFIGGALSIITAVLFFGSIAFFLFGGTSGFIYNIVWVVLLGGWVLYDTSNILHHRHVREHVAASVDLLVDFVYMFIHIAMLLLRSSSD